MSGTASGRTSGGGRTGHEPHPADTPPDGIEVALRAAAVAAAGLGLLAGMAGAAVAGLLRQARTTAESIERYQQEDARSHPPGPPGRADGPGRGVTEAAMAAARADGSFAPPAAGEIGDPDQRAVDAAAQRRLPEGDGTYRPDGRRREPGAAEPDPDVLRLAMLGDSTAVGFGCTTADELPGVMLARGLADAAGRPVVLHTVGTVGVGAADLDRQLDLVLPSRPDVVVILVGANDLRDRVSPQQSARELGTAVERAGQAGVPVVVGTCPDFGVIQSIPQPLRTVLRSWSHRLAELQAREVDRAGGEPVAIGRLVSPEFAGRPDLFAADRFHPSGAGYARAVDALLPAVVRHVPGGRPRADQTAGHTG